MVLSGAVAGAASCEGESIFTVASGACNTYSEIKCLQVKRQRSLDAIVATEQG